MDGLVYTIQGSANLQAWTQYVAEHSPTDSVGLPPLRDIDGDGTPDWEYRAFVLDNNTLPRGFLRSRIQPAP